LTILFLSIKFAYFATYKLINLEAENRNALVSRGEKEDGRRTIWKRYMNSMPTSARFLEPEAIGDH